MKTKIRLPIISFKKIEIDSDELEDFCITQIKENEKFCKPEWFSPENYGQLSIDEIQKTENSIFYETLFHFLAKVYPGIYRELFNFYLMYEQESIDKDLYEFFLESLYEANLQPEKEICDVLRTRRRPQTATHVGVQEHLPVNFSKTQITLIVAFFREVYGVDINSQYRSWILNILLQHPNIYYCCESIQETIDKEHSNIKMRYKLSDEDYFNTIDYINDFVEVVTVLSNYVHIVKIKESVHIAYKAFVKGVYAEINLDS